jgi:hypothetical protein
MEIFRATETIRHTTLTLTGQDIIDLLDRAGLLEPNNHIRVQFSVPSGGDYSGMTLEIDKSTPITVISNKSEVIEGE